MNLIKHVLSALLLVTLSVLSTELVSAQSGVPFNQRDDEYRVLGLKRAKEAFEYARAELEQKQELFERNLISELELAKSRSVFADAEVNYQQSLLAVLFEGQYVAVEEAVKYQDKNGKKHVRLKIKNTAGGEADFKQLIETDEELFRSLQPDVIHDVYVSLLNDENAIISQPYEAKIEQLKYGLSAEIDFTLLQDLDAVTVNLVFGKGNQRSPKIYLQKDASVNKVLVQSEQFSQEVELGSEATFGLTLELFSGLNNTFKLEVVNLPNQINRYFRDSESNARLSQFRFTESTNTRNAGLTVFLPDRPTQEVEMDKPIGFYVLVIPRDRLKEIGNVRDKTWTQSEIEALDIGFVKLELVPRGIGRLLVRAPQLYYSIRAGETVSMNVELVNEGTRGLNNVEIATDPPLNWTDRVEPKVISNLDISEEKRVNLAFTPPKDVSVGRYEVRIRTSSMSDDRPINGEDKMVTIEVLAEANVFGTIVLVMLIVGLVLGIVVYGVRLSRR